MNTFRGPSVIELVVIIALFIGFAVPAKWIQTTIQNATEAQTGQAFH